MALTSNIDWEYETRTWPCPHQPHKSLNHEGAHKQVRPEAGVWRTYHRHTDGSTCHLVADDSLGPWTRED